jgi:hypothetical protein
VWIGYTHLRKELGHAGDIGMAESILKGTLDNKLVEDEEIRGIVEKLKRHPAIQAILTHIVTANDFQSCFK